MIAAALLMLFAAPPATAASPPAAQSETIVVTGARPGKCRMRLANRALSDRQFETHAGQWARLGLAIRVAHPPDTHYLCLARIAIRREKRGVRLFHFVEQGEAR